MWFHRLRRKWRFWKFGAVEEYYFQLKDNKTYPFQDLGDGFYYILIRSDRFVFGVALLIVAIISFTLFVSVIGYFSFPCILFILVFIYSLLCLYGNVAPKELIINRYSGYILRVKGNEKIIVEEPINNIYIKLQRKFDTNLLPHYYLILGGFRLDDIRLTGFCMKDGPLRILGGGVAARMGLNFFDVDNNSSIHKIYHYPNQSLLPPHEVDWHNFLALHGLTEKDVKKAMKKEGLQVVEDADKVPKSIVKRTMANYGQPAGTSRHHFAETERLRRSKTLATMLALDEQRRLGGTAAAAAAAAAASASATAAAEKEAHPQGGTAAAASATATATTAAQGQPHPQSGTAEAAAEASATAAAAQEQPKSAPHGGTTPDKDKSKG